jgi:basic membrane protein A and related proteins
MRIRSLGLVAIGGLSIMLSACSSGGGASAGASAAAPTATPDPCAGAAKHSGDARTLPTDKSAIKIGVAADVGKIDDKNFNEYTYKGATEAATALGISGAVPFVTPAAATDRIPNIQKFVDEGFNIIVTAGFANGTATGCVAKQNPDVWFIGVDQGPPAAGAELPNYVQLSYQEDQAGYLAGMVAASVSKTGTIGAIGGITLCGPCVRYIQGYELGAKSINPDIKVETVWVTESDFNKAFNDPVTGKAVANQLITQKNPDVLFQVAGKTGNGVLEAACEKGIYAVGVDVDQALSNPDTAKCTVTSAEKKLTTSVSTNIANIVAGTAKGGDDHWDAKRDGIGASPFHDLASVVPADVQGKLDAAFAAMKAGTLKTCPSKATGDAVDCGSLK